MRQYCTDFSIENNNIPSATQHSSNLGDMIDRSGWKWESWMIERGERKRAVVAIHQHTVAFWFTLELCARSINIYENFPLHWCVHRCYISAEPISNLPHTYICIYKHISGILQRCRLTVRHIRTLVFQPSIKFSEIFQHRSLINPRSGNGKKILKK